MSDKTKRIIILSKDELSKTLTRLTSEVVEKVKNLDNLLLVGIPTRGVDLTRVLEKELFFTIFEILTSSCWIILPEPMVR